MFWPARPDVPSNRESPQPGAGDLPVPAERAARGSWVRAPGHGLGSRNNAGLTAVSSFCLQVILLFRGKYGFGFFPIVSVYLIEEESRLIRNLFGGFVVSAAV